MVQGFAQQAVGHLIPATVRANQSTRLKNWAMAALMALSGATAAVAVCWPFAHMFRPGQPQWWLQILAMLPLLLFLQHCKSARLAFTHTAVYATAWLCATFWWLFVAMHTYGSLPAVLAIIAVLGLACTLALYYGFAGFFLWKYRYLSPAWTAMIFAALWTMAEMARGTWFTGFGWGAMAYAHTSGPLSQWIPVLGAYGVGALAAWCAASIAFIRRAGWLHRLSLVSLLLAGLLPGHFDVTTSTGSLSIALLQGNIPQDEKFDSSSGVPLALSWYAQHMQTSQVDLVLAPETAIPLLPQELPDGYWDALNQQVQRGHSALLTGIPLGDYTQGYTNSVIALQPGSTDARRYDKHHLVPFGEFIPPLFKWFTRMMNIPLGDFNRGAIGQPSFAWKGQRIAPNICYEDLFGEELGARFYDQSSAPTVFANVSNLAWFGDTIAIDQHLQISRMRALEFQRPFLRATNTGATVIMDYQGNVTSSLPHLRQGVLLGTVEGRTGTTPFAWWVSRFGLWPLWLLSLVVLTMAMLLNSASMKQPKHQRAYQDSCVPQHPSPAP